MTFVSYPRLHGAAATELLLKLSDAPPAQRLEVAEPFVGRATTYATAMALAGREDMQRLREAILELATANGFPSSPPAAGFDAQLPELLMEQLVMAPAEAGTSDVWNYMTLVLLPDVALWRWPNPANNPAYERLIGKPRNVFRRHWWRAYLLGPTLARQLNEDELVQIVERPATLGGDPRVARAAAQAFLDFVATHSLEVNGHQRSFKRMELMRAAAKRIMRIGRVVVLSTLTDEQLASLMREMFERCGEAEASEQRGTMIRPAENIEAVVRTEPDVQATNALADGLPDVEPEVLLHHEIVRIYERAEEQLGINSGPIRRMLTDFGGLGAAKLLLEQGFNEWDRQVEEAGRTDLLIETLVIKPEFSPLFTKEEVDRARALLANMAGEVPPSPPESPEGHDADRAVTQPPRAVIERKLHRAMVTAYETCKAELGYNATAFIRMISEMGGYQTALRLVRAPSPSEGFLRLLEEDRLDLSIEALILYPEFRSLFDDETIDLAERRLEEYGVS